MMADVVVITPPDTASPKDPNELSFGRGEIFNIIDKSGKWWEAEMADGRKGSKSCLFPFCWFCSLMCHTLSSCTIKLLTTFMMRHASIAMDGSTNYLQPLCALPSMQQSSPTPMDRSCLRLLRCILMLPGPVTGFPCSYCFIEGLVTGLDDTLHEPRRY